MDFLLTVACNSSSFDMFHVCAIVCGTIISEERPEPNRQDEPTWKSGGSQMEPTKPQRLLEDDGWDAPVVSEGTRASLTRCQEVVSLLAEHPDRTPFGPGAERAAVALKQHLVAQGIDARLLPVATSGPLGSAAVWYALAQVLVVTLGFLSLEPAVVLSLLLVLSMWSEWLGGWRPSAWLFPPRGGVGVEAIIQPGTPDKGGQEVPSLWVVAALDIPQADVMFHTGPFRKGLAPLLQLRATPLLLFAGWLSVTPLLLIWWMLSGLPIFLWWMGGWSGILMLLCVALWGMTTNREEAGQEAAALAVALEAAIRLKQLSIPSEIRLLLLPSLYGGGIEAYSKEQPLRSRQKTSVIFIEPLGGKEEELVYATHQGILVPMPLPLEEGQLLDWLKARLALSEQRTNGSSVYRGPRPSSMLLGCEFVRRHGLERVLRLGAWPNVDEHADWLEQFRPLSQTLQEHPLPMLPDGTQMDWSAFLWSSLSHEQLDDAAGFVVSYVQAMCSEE